MQAATPAVYDVNNIEIVPPEGWDASTPWWMWLPKGYTRTPLSDITGIVKAIERERRRLQGQAAARVTRDNRLDPTPNTIPMVVERQRLQVQAAARAACVIRADESSPENSTQGASDRKRAIQRKTLMSMR